MDNKKEQTHLNSEEVNDDEVIRKIRNFEMNLKFCLLLLPCLVLNMVLQLCSRYIDGTVLLVCTSFFTTIALAASIVLIVSAINLVKLKKTLQKQVKDAPKSGKAAEK